MTQEEAVALFHQAHRLADAGMSKKLIARTLSVSRSTVIGWLKADAYQEHRGWKAERARKYTDPGVAERIRKIKRHRLDNCYLVGSDHVQKDYALELGKATTAKDRRVPSLWYIETVTRKANLQAQKPRGRVKGGAQYLLYPACAIERLGQLQQAADFIGKKYLEGRSKPVTIFSHCYYRPFKLHHIVRAEAEKAAFAIEALSSFWHRYPVTQVLRLDNAGSFIGSGSAQRVLGTFMIFLLNLGVVPLFAAPRSPWMNGHVEGHNRVFSSTVWKKNHFRSLEDLDTENERFNEESEALFRFKYQHLAARFQGRVLVPSVRINKDVLRSRRGKRVCFVRFAEREADEDTPSVSIMNETIQVPEAYAHQFVFGEWNLQEQVLSLVSEYERRLTLVKRVPFLING